MAKSRHQRLEAAESSIALTKSSGGGVITFEKLAELRKSGKPIEGGFLVVPDTCSEEAWLAQYSEVNEYQAKLMDEFFEIPKPVIPEDDEADIKVIDKNLKPEPQEKVRKIKIFPGQLKDKSRRLWQDAHGIWNL